jgi:hypothetical protein
LILAGQNMKAKYKLDFSPFSNQGLLISSEYAGTLQCQHRSPGVSPRPFLDPSPPTVLQCSLFSTRLSSSRNILPLYPHGSLMGGVWGFAVVVRTEGDLRLDGLCEGGGQSGSWLLRIEEACSGSLNFMSVSDLLFAAFVPLFATFASNTRCRYPLRPTLRSRKATLGMLSLSAKENTYWLFSLRGIADLPLFMPNAECASMRSVSRGGRY